MIFDDIQYLKSGTKRQREAYALLRDHNILECLKAFDPVLVGTIPINIDLETSDLDIICHWTVKQNFISVVTKCFSHQGNFKLCESPTDNAVISSFMLHHFEIEIFGQDIPTRQQPGYRHMIVEHDILVKKGEGFRQQILDLKRRGYKTEPAFAIALGLTGDPYTALLNFSPTS
jgi:hypothetical protein